MMLFFGDERGFVFMDGFLRKHVQDQVLLV